MKVLIVFGTVEGQSRKIAEFISGLARSEGHEVTLVDAAASPASAAIAGFDRVILAAPVHERRHPKAFEAFIVGHRAELARVMTLMLSVSLSAAFEEGMEDAQDYLTELQMRTGFTSDAECLVEGAVKPGSYDYFEAQVIRYVVLKDRGYAPGLGSHEFTNWENVANNVRDFLSAEQVQVARNRS